MEAHILCWVLLEADPAMRIHTQAIHYRNARWESGKRGGEAAHEKGRSRARGDFRQGPPQPQPTEHSDCKSHRRAGPASRLRCWSPTVAGPRLPGRVWRGRRACSNTPGSPHDRGTPTIRGKPGKCPDADMSCEAHPSWGQTPRPVKGIGGDRDRAWPVSLAVSPAVPTALQHEEQEHWTVSPEVLGLVLGAATDFPV